MYLTQRNTKKTHFTASRCEHTSLFHSSTGQKPQEETIGNQEARERTSKPGTTGKTRKWTENKHY